MKTGSHTLAVIGAAVALVMAACGDTAQPTTTAPLNSTIPLDVNAAPPENYAEFRAQPTACDAQQPATATNQTYAAPEDQALDPTKVIRVLIETSCGDIVAELDPALAPETVNSFVFLAREGYFDGTAAHRILPGFVVQAGDPTATGRGNPGYSLPDEFPPEGFVYERGILAMANAGSGTTGSQFFIMLGDSGLPPSFSAFGRVVEGMDVLDLIAATPLGDRTSGFSVEQSVPLETLYVERVVVEE